MSKNSTEIYCYFTNNSPVLGYGKKKNGKRHKGLIAKQANKYLKSYRQKNT